MYLVSYQKSRVRHEHRFKIDTTQQAAATAAGAAAAAAAAPAATNCSGGSSSSSSATPDTSLIGVAPDGGSLVAQLFGGGACAADHSVWRSREIGPTNAQQQ